MTAEASPPPGADRPGASPLVGPETVARALQEGLASGTPPVLLDVRWTLAGSDSQAYAAGHLPGAVFVDLDRELADPPGAAGRHPLPALPILEGLVRRAGIHDDSTIVVYGQRDASVAARAWWLLRWAGLANVAVLDGGFEAWQRAGGPVATGVEPDPGGGTATLRPGAMPTVDADGAAELGSGRHSVLLDAREPARYRGELEPVDPVAGHIPGAANLPLAVVHRPHGHLRDAHELRAVFEQAGIDDAVPAAASCGSGVTACALILAGAVAGYRLALYPGSYSGWCSSGRAVATG